MATFIDLTGQRFGRLIVIERVQKEGYTNAFWKCRCDCGKEIVTSSRHLRSGHTQSCGCYQRERAAEYHTVHGMKGTKLLSVYSAMKGRCYNPSDGKYYRYGARGIKMCDEWKNNPSAFFNWALSNGYSEGLSIDRIDNDGNYCTENCRWVDALTQANNKSSNHYYTYEGVTKTISQWAKELGQNYATIKRRIYDGSFERLYDIKNANCKFVTHNGITKSIKEWAEYLNINYSTIRSRVKKGSFDRLFPKDKEI